MRRKDQQLEFDFRQHGGRRKGAGRKPKSAEPSMPHRQRSEKKRSEPLHITVRLADGLPSLRRGGALKLVLAALSASSDRHGMRVVHGKKHRVVPQQSIDLCSSALVFDGRRLGPSIVSIPSAPSVATVATASTWLLTSGWRRHGLLDIHELPQHRKNAGRPRGNLAESRGRAASH